MEYFKRATELKEDTILNRRHIHKNAEVGLDLPKTKSFVAEKLKEYGLEPEECGHGITAMVGKKGKVFLLRADMDALPMGEESGLEFACNTGTEAHTCGHDIHTSMLLTAAKMLKENEDNLEGTVKFMFQPAEEIFKGAKDMIKAGILENPKVDAAFGLHVAAGKLPLPMIIYNNKSALMYSVDVFKIVVKGKGSHGATPHLAIDPINIAVHIYLGFQELIARENNPSHSCVLTIGQLEAGSAPNIIPENAILQGTIRTNNKEARELLVKRMKEVAKKTAEVYGGNVEIEMIADAPPLICDTQLTDSLVRYIREMKIPDMKEYAGMSATTSEDFAVVVDKVPGVFMFVSAGFPDERGNYQVHNSKVQFNEDVCPIGAAILAECATRWLEENK